MLLVAKVKKLSKTFCANLFFFCLYNTTHLVIGTKEKLLFLFQCLKSWKITRKFYPIIASKICCLNRKIQKVFCVEKPSENLLCHPAMKKILAETLENLQNGNKLANDDIKCCTAEKIECCENGKRHQKANL